MRNRKGSMIDMFLLVIVFVVLAVFILVGIYLKDNIFPQLTDMFGESNEGTEVLDTAEAGYSTMDYIFLFLFFGLCLTPIILAFFVRNHPVFFIINLIIIVIFFIVTPSLSNMVRSFWAEDEFAPYALGGSGSHTFPVMTRIFQYLPLITCGISVVLMIVMFNKGRGATSV